MKTDKKRRAVMRKIRKGLHLSQNELAALAGLPEQSIAHLERGKHVSQATEDRVSEALIRMSAKRNPDALKRAAEPAQKLVESCEKILALEPGSQSALEIERLNGKSLSEVKAQAEAMAHLLGTVLENARLLTQ